jgi:hypothetical protein
MCRHTQNSAPPHPSDYRSCYDCGHPISWHKQGEENAEIKRLSSILRNSGQEVMRLRALNAELLAINAELLIALRRISEGLE